MRIDRPTSTDHVAGDDVSRVRESHTLGKLGYASGRMEEGLSFFRFPWSPVASSSSSCVFQYRFVGISSIAIKKLHIFSNGVIVPSNMDFSRLWPQVGKYSAVHRLTYGRPNPTKFLLGLLDHSDGDGV